MSRRAARWGMPALVLAAAAGTAAGCGPAGLSGRTGGAADRLGTAQQALEVLSWHQASVQPGPQARYGASMAGTDDRVYLFGGMADSTTNTPLQDFWSFDGNTWKELPSLATGATGPLERWMAAMAWDPDLKVIVLYGGLQLYSGKPLDDTWIFDPASGTDGAWSPVTGSATTPGARHGMSMAYDPGAGGMVILGGTVAKTNQPADDLWVLDMTTRQWATETGVGTAFGSSTGGRFAYGLAHDDTLGTVFYGGRYDFAQDDTVTLTWSNGTPIWTAGPPTGPGARAFLAMAADTSFHQIVVYGGYDGSVALSDTWTFDGQQWNEPAVSGQVPPARRGAAMAYLGGKSGHAEMVLFGGRAGSSPAKAIDGTTWTLDRTNVTVPDGGTADGGGTTDGGGVVTDGGGGVTDGGTRDGGGGVADGGTGTPDGGGPALASPYGCENAGGAGAGPGALALVLVALLLLARRRTGAALAILCAVALVPVAARAGGPEAHAVAAKKPRIVFLGLKREGRISRSDVTTLSEYVKTKLDALGRYDVVGMSDVRTILGVAAQRQLAGCKGDDTECMAQIAGTLGARRLISGTVSRVGHSLILNLVFLDAKAAASVGRVARRVRTSGGVEPLLDLVGPALSELVARDHLPGLVSTGTPAPAGKGPAHPTPAHPTPAHPTPAHPTPADATRTRAGAREPAPLADAPGEAADVSAPADTDATPHIAPAIPAAPSAPIGLTVGLRAEALLPAPGYALGLSGVYQPGLAGVGVTVLLRPLAFRLDGRLRAYEAGPLTVDLALGLTGFTTGVAARLAAGASLHLGALELGADLAWEPPIVGPIVPWDVLLGAHVGWRL